ncbi:hypothetical protein AB6A40_007221 [Gnathostoma spinigerum]|uniref:ATP synthase F0 subunit 8 n=1 Tax=Gnathostoma spinigerum TaxID=75299 RepID=A0ABD6EVB3_9BILA
MVSLLSIFAVWLTLFSICFTFLPMFQVLDWRKRNSAEGFSSINLVLPCLIKKELRAAVQFAGITCPTYANCPLS